MRRIHYVFILLLVGSVALVRYDIFRRENSVTIAKESWSAARVISELTGDLTAGLTTSIETNSEKVAVNKSTNASVVASVEAAAIIKKEQKKYL